MVFAAGETLTIGLTGGVASGKSLVQAAFESLGVPVLDADQVARAVVAPGMPALKQIAEQFGAEMLLADGTLNRRQMRERVFNDPQARKQLEAITHPPMRSAMRDWCAAQQTPYCVLSIAILIEAGMHEFVDRVLVVDAPEDVQLRRLQSRDHITAELANAMLAAQATRAQRLSAADDVLANVGTPTETMASVTQLHAFYIDIARQNNPRAPGLRLPPSVI